MLARRNQFRSWHLGKRPGWALLLLLATVAWTGAAWAQLPIPASTQFDLVGFLEEATVNTAGNALSGGTLKVNGHVVTVPASTIVILPANALTWEELFSQAPAPWGVPGTLTPGGGIAFNGAVAGPTTGMALADCAVAPSATGCAAPPLTTYEVHVVGNRVLADANHPTDQYIAGLINISQQGLNSGAGFINFIDLNVGEMRVGGVIGSNTTGTRVRINDPTGRYGRVMSPDPRFTVDPDNPTIMAGTGFPMCLPRSAAADPLCPQTNRPAAVAPATGFAATIDMPAPPAAAGGPDPTQQAPFEVGDFVTFAGTLVKDAPATGFALGDGPTVGPFPQGTAAVVGPPPVPATTGTDHTYISAHTIVNNVAIYTAPGSNPAYVMTDVTLMGTGGLTVLGAGEAAVRTRFEGMTTDPSRNIHLYGIDLDPLTGATTDRDWGTIGVDPGPAAGGAVKGRWRFRPPCTAAVATQKDCTPPLAGTFLPPTREMRAVIEGLQSQNPANPGAVPSANGIFYGQYHAPISEYIFPENIPGTPIVENNFNAIPFLACGGYSSSGIGIAGGQPPPFTPTLAGPLVPWPSNVLPSCAGTPPVANAGAPQTVPPGATVTLNGGGSTGAGLSFFWTQTGFGGLPPVNLLPSASSAVVTFTAPNVAATTVLTFSLTVTNTTGSSTATTTVTIQANAPPPDTVTITLVEYRISRQRLTVQATSSAGAAATLTLQPYIATDGTQQPGGVLTVQAGIPTIIEVGVKQPAAGLSITVTSSAGGSARSAITRLR